MKNQQKPELQQNGRLALAHQPAWKIESRIIALNPKV
jgi:hypothetical protein